MKIFNKRKNLISIILIVILVSSFALDTYAQSGKEVVDNAMASVSRVDENGKQRDSETVAKEILAARENAGRSIKIDSNDRKDWPQGPVITPTAAVLMDIDTGVTLYSKDATDKLYPASITKILTALIACENCSKDTKVVFSNDAVFTYMEQGSANMGFKVGEEITMDQALRCLLCASANEVANAIAETVAGSVPEFAKMMNSRAIEMGCVSSHFTNPSGLHSDDHYVTANDMAVIAATAYENEWFREVCSLPRYNRPVTKMVNDPWEQLNKHEMFRDSAEHYYEYATGGKTGGTDQARSTLVTYAEKDGRRLVCVLLYGIGGQMFNPTRDLFEYGFNNFKDKDLAKYIKEYGLYEEKIEEPIKKEKPLVKSPNKEKTKVIDKTTTDSTGLEKYIEIVSAIWEIGVNHLKGFIKYIF